MGVHAGPADWWSDWTANTDAGRDHIATQSVVQSGLTLNLDAGVSRSYSGTGNTWSDLSGNGKDGTLINGPTFSSANGGAIVFDGTNDHVTASSTVMPSGTDLFTYSLWVNFTSITGAFGGGYYGAVLLSAYNTGVMEIVISTASTASTTPKTLSISRYGGGTTGSCSVDVSSFMSNGSWYNIVVMRTAVAEEKIYVNNVLRGTGNVSNSFLGGTAYIGGVGGGNYTGYLNGKIACAKLYNRAITENEIAQNFTALRGRFGI